MGRKAIFGEPMSAAMRARRYRGARNERVRATIEDIEGATDARLLELLKHYLPATTVGKRKVVGWVVAELAKRYPPPA